MICVQFKVYTASLKNGLGPTVNEQIKLVRDLLA